MIVTCNAPAGAEGVRYGKSQLGMNDDGSIEVPAFVAKTLVTKAGFASTANLSQTASALFAAAEDWEKNYIFAAYGQALPADTVISHAGEQDEEGAAVPDETIPVDRPALAAALWAEKGEPNASVI